MPDFSASYNPLTMQTAGVSPQDIETIERATVATVSPEITEELDGWLLPFDGGTIGRAKSAVPLAHHETGVDLIGKIEARYRSRGFPPMFRVADEPCFHSLQQALRGAGYRADRHSVVQIALSSDVRSLVAEPRAHVAVSPDEAWGKVFLGEGFDPVDGASRVKALSRTPDAVYASIRDDDGTGALASGAASFAHGWASIHAMRTALAHRREGLAGRILSALAQVALDRGFERIFLQVEENNSSAQSLYRRAGFETAWRYEYWSRRVL